MSCNITEYIENVNLNCNNDLLIVKDNCKIICMMSVLVLLDRCSDWLKLMNLDKQLEEIVKWCYYKKLETEMQIS
jgi:hypothetical protein